MYLNNLEVLNTLRLTRSLPLPDEQGLRFSTMSWKQPGNLSLHQSEPGCIDTLRTGYQTTRSSTETGPWIPHLLMGKVLIAVVVEAWWIRVVAKG